MNNIIKRKWNQNSMVIIEDLQGMAFQAESGGHTFQISGIDGEGNAVALSGTPAGVMLRSDGQDVTLTCSVSGGVVSATLPANAYSVPGRFGLTIFLTSDGQKTAIYAAVGTVGKTSSGTVAPPAGSDVVDLVNAIAAAVATIPASYTDLMAAMAPTYSSSGLYAVGSYAWYNGKLYRCTTAITSGETWTSGHWTLANLGGDLVDLKSAIGGIQTGEMDGFRHVSVWVNGTWSGMTLNNTNTRIRPIEWIFVKAGDVISIKNGSFVHAVCLWAGDFTTHTNIRNDNAWKNTDEDIAITADGYFIVAFANATSTSTVVNPASFDGSVTIYSYAMRLSIKTNQEITNIKSCITNIADSFTDGYKRFDFGSYDSTYHFSEITVYGINSQIVIDANGGNLVERISNVNYPIIDKTVMVVNGNHTFRVYSDTENEPYLMLCNGSWIGGYVNGDGSFTSNSTRATRFIAVLDEKFDVEVSNSSLMTVTAEYDNGYTELVKEVHYYTLNKGNYAIVIMNSNKTSTITKSTLDSFSMSNAVFPKVTGFPYYEEIKYTKLGAGGQGICCTDEFVYQFNGLGGVYKYDFEGNFIERVGVSGIGHCNSATFDGTYIYVVDSGNNATIYKLNTNLETVGEPISKSNLLNLAYSDDGYFYGIKATSLNASQFASGISLYRMSSDLSTETEIKSSFLPDLKYVIQGIEIQGEQIIVCLLDTSFQGIIAYFSKAGSLVKWRYAQYAKYYEFEDAAINYNGDMFTSYQGNSGEGLPLIMAKCESVTRFNASKYATNIGTGVGIGKYHQPLTIYADEDHAILNGIITGISAGSGNLARVPASILPHIVYKYFHNGYIASLGSTAKDNANLPLISVSSGEGTSVEYNDFYVNLKNNKWNTSAL